MLKRLPVILLIVILSFPLGMRLAGERSQETPLGAIDFSLSLHPTGAGEFYVPLADWGVEVDLFDAPLLLRADPRAVDRENILLLAEGEEGMLQESEKSILQGIVFLVMQNIAFVFLFVFLIAFVTASLMSFPRKKLILESLGVATAFIVIFAFSAFVTYSPDSIEEPKFYARGSELKQLVEVIDREIDEEDGSYISEFDRVLRGMGRFLTASEDMQSTSPDQALLLSDLHSNALVLPSLEDFSGNKPVFFVGDFAHQGNDAEALLLASRVSDLSPNVIAVSGNHDSASLMTSLAKEGVTVLGEGGILQKDGSWKEGLLPVGEWRVAGYRDPLEWKGSNPDDPRRIFSFQEISDEVFLKEEKKIKSWWQGLAQKPDLLLIHQESLALSLAEYLKDYPKRLTILTGHTHKPSLVRIGNVSVVNGGAAGAGGIFGLGSEDAEIAGLHFSQERLRFVDFVAVDPTLGTARAERINTEDEVCAQFCLYEPNWGETVRLGSP